VRSWPPVLPRHQAVGLSRRLQEVTRFRKSCLLVTHSVYQYIYRQRKMYNNLDDIYLQRSLIASLGTVKLFLLGWPGPSHSLIGLLQPWQLVPWAL
jgi:hypothetical protein